MRTQGVMQREFAGPKFHRNGLAVIERLDDLLAASIEAVLEPRRLVMSLFRRAVRRKDFHAACGLACVGESKPSRDVFVRSETEVGGILVPRDKCRRIRLLDEERAPINQNI